jgi:signal transduction histidine kinase
MDTQIAPLRTLLKAFPGIPETEAQELISLGEVQAYPKGVVLCHEDAYETTFYIILDGQVKVTKVINHDEDRQLNILEAGDFFGEMALIHNAPRAASVTTISPATMLEIRKDAFDSLLKHSASVARAMVQEVSRRLRENDAMAIEDLRLKAGELAAAYQQLAEQEYIRRQFLTTIAHELRTPLTAASGFLQMIESGLMNKNSFDTQVQHTALKSASRNIQQIVALVNDILFIQEMDLILPRFERLELSQVIESTVAALRPKIEENHLQLELNIPNLPPIPGDAKSLERAFGAILDNAIKFSYDGGRIDIRAGEEGSRVWVDVQDQGVGIPAEVMPRIFDRFFHIDQIDDRMFRGAGLGLSIARQVIEQHNGQIQVDSQLRRGTTLRIYLNKSN